MDRLNTNEFQFPVYALPGSARKLMLLTYVAKIDIPTTNPDIPFPAVIKSPAVLFFRKNELPNSTVPRVKTRKITISITVNCIKYN
ncbi:hypothetical protein SDC9_101736 [bioreactor metagenome]|jgi:hypothetical protein|uniref:Uncharacterized protein n=1 Tax=bioreactor metagenome TaxID=1076179 RepID=A0A645AVL8_9ZZZZ